MADTQSLAVLPHAARQFSTWFGIGVSSVVRSSIVLAVIGPSPRTEVITKKRAQKSGVGKIEALHEERPERTHDLRHGSIRSKGVARIPIVIARWELTVADLAQTKARASRYDCYAPPLPRLRRASRQRSGRNVTRAAAPARQGNGSGRLNPNGALPGSPRGKAPRAFSSTQQSTHPRTCFLPDRTTTIHEHAQHSCTAPAE